jgi:glutathionyl-hydroquinone reductase
VVVDGWLAQMNARRNIIAPPAARNYVRLNTNYNGKIKHPVLTMHTIIDPLVVVANESAYAELIATTNRDDLLFQTYTNANGHCAFTPGQLLTAVAAIDGWVRTGVRPTNASFPVALGFAPTFVPPPMLQP